MAEAACRRCRPRCASRTRKSALSRNDSPDIPFDRSLNPYRGCEHGCIYCFARPTHSYLGLSPGLDFETKLIAKRNIAEVLRAELGRKAYRPSQIAIGTATDCYQPIERELRLTRSVIEVLQETRHPFGLVTKSSAVERDLDLIAPMAAERLAAVYVTDHHARRRTGAQAGAARRRAAPAAAHHCARWPMPACRWASAWRRRFPSSPRTWSRCSKPPGRPARAAPSTP